MFNMEEFFDRHFSFTEEEKEKLSKIVNEVAQLLKTKELANNEVLYVLSKCEDIVWQDVFNNHPEEQ